MAIASDGYILGANRTRLGFEASGWKCDAVRYVLPSKHKRRARKKPRPVAFECKRYFDSEWRPERAPKRKARKARRGGNPGVTMANELLMRDPRFREMLGAKTRKGERSKR